MSATLTEPTAAEQNGHKPSTREEAAQMLFPLLTNEPQTEAALRRKLFGTSRPARTSGRGENDMARMGLQVLEAQHRAMRIPGSTGSRLGGWVKYDPKLAAVEVATEDIEFKDMEWGVKVSVADCFVDVDYQRPLTTFVQAIFAHFDPHLFGLVALSDRGPKHRPKRYAIIDGQTRWAAATRRKISTIPAIVYTNLTPEQEADLFERLQTQRRGVASWYRFRAALRAKRPEAIAIQKLVKGVGYEIGDRDGQISAISALESSYRTDAFLLERSLGDFQTAFPKAVPDGEMIRGLHRFFKQYPMDAEGDHKPPKGKQQRPEIDDEQLTRRLGLTGLGQLRRDASLAKDASMKEKVPAGKDRWMSVAIQKAYNKK